MFKRIDFRKPLFVLFVAILPLFATSFALSARAGQSAYARQAATLTPVSSRAGAFSVMMPGPARYESRPITTVSGHQVTQHVYSTSAADGRYFYSVAYNDYPYALDADALNRVCAGQAEGMKGRIVRQEAITVSGYSGRMLRIEGNGFIAVSQAVIVGRRLYQVMFVMPSGSTTAPPEAKDFLVSFRITA